MKLRILYILILTVTVVLSGCDITITNNEQNTTEENGDGEDSEQGGSDTNEDQLEGVVWETDLDTAISKAAANNRLVLLCAGRPACGNTTYMKNTIFEKPSIEEILGDDYVIADINVDNDSSYYPYASGMNSFMLPLIAIIDPDNSTTYYKRSTGVVYEDEFLAFLQDGSSNLLSTINYKIAMNVSNAIKLDVICVKRLGIQ
jgi:thioredoxin-related protein